MKLPLLLKDVLDVTLGIACLIALVPVFLAIGIAIKLDSPGPIFFKQRRVGKNGKPFMVHKFRSMVEDAENIGLGVNIAKDDPRITAVGNFLRDWSLDELPQIINIVRGEMSFIGPRPTLQHQVDCYTPRQRRRLDMKPGITGWAQVNGRDTVPWPERIEMDIWYIDNWSFWLDMKIFFKTFKIVFGKGDVYSDKGISYDLTSSDNQKDKQGSKRE